MNTDTRSRSPFGVSLILSVGLLSLSSKAAPQPARFLLSRPNGFVELQLGSGVYNGPESAVAVDANADGRPDLLHAPSFWKQEPELPLQIFLNQGGGVFVEAASSAIDAVPTTGYLNGPTIVADFNGDEADDVFLVDQGLEVDFPNFPNAQPKLLLSNGSGRLTNATATHLPLIDEFNHNASAADIDNDGDIDIAVAALSDVFLYVLINDGQARFDMNTEIFPASLRSFDFDPGAVKLADVNGDGRADAIVGTYINSTRKGVAFSLQNLSGQFEEPSEVALRSDLSDGAIDLILAEDFDSDTDLDVIVRVDTFGDDEGAGLMALRNDGGEFVDVTEDWFGAARFSDLVPDIRVAGLQIHDFDRDGVPDISFLHAGIRIDQLGEYLFVNDGMGHFSPMEVLSAPDPTEITPYYVDHDRDGDLDIVGLVPEITELAPATFVQDGYEIVVLEYIPAQRFNDVAADHWAHSFIETLAVRGVTSGCGGDNFCPNGNVTRAQMAVFLERGMRGSQFLPTAATGAVFDDVPIGSFAASWIEQLAVDGITSGCGRGYFCPGDPVTRAQMAVFLLRAIHGSDHVPPPAVGVFNDVPPGAFAANWIEQFAVEGITSGCGNGNYCPDDPVTRAQMAVFLVRAFGL